MYITSKYISKGNICIVNRRIVLRTAVGVVPKLLFCHSLAVAHIIQFSEALFLIH